MKLLTINEIKARVDLSEYIGRFVEVKKAGNRLKCLCPFHDDNRPSMGIYIDKNGYWRYACRSCEANGDLVDFVMEYNNVDYKGAFEILKGDYQGLVDITPRKVVKPKDPYEDLEPVDIGDNEILPLIPIRVFNPVKNKMSTMRYERVFRYKYGFFTRYSINGTKIYSFIKLCVHKKSGELMWSQHKFLDSERTFYGRLLPKGVVVVFEGEKTTDAAMEIFKGTPTSTICWSGGTNQVNKTDWTVLQDRKVILFPDNDEPGYAAVNYISQFLNNFKIVAAKDEEKGWDIADRPFTREELIKYMSERYVITLN